MTILFVSFSIITSNKHNAANFSHVETELFPQYVRPEELEEAQIRARHDLLIARLQQNETPQEPSTPVQEVNKPAHPQSGVQSISGKKKNVVTDKTSTRPKPRPHLPIRQGIGEENLRLRQLSKFVDQINSSVAHLDKLWKEDCPSKEFVTPLDNDVKQKRWEEFLRSTRRSLFSLKQEVLY